jgi:hypothetical protein
MSIMQENSARYHMKTMQNRLGHNIWTLYVEQTRLPARETLTNTGLVDEWILAVRRLTAEKL